MEYLSCSDASKAMGFSVRRIQQMCKNGELPGAIKEGRKWLIPDETIHMNHFAKNKSLPIGVSDFKLATTGYYYVDKTLMIRDFLDKKPMVSLFTRPRRFGKTLNMDMLRVFFEKTNEDTSVYFKDKQIWQCGDYYTKHQGQYPVIFLTFKDVKSMTWEETFQKIRRLISLEFCDLRLEDRILQFFKPGKPLQMMILIPGCPCQAEGLVHIGVCNGIHKMPRRTLLSQSLRNGPVYRLCLLRLRRCRR